MTKGGNSTFLPFRGRRAKRGAHEVGNGGRQRGKRSEKKDNKGKKNIRLTRRGKGMLQLSRQKVRRGLGACKKGVSLGKADELYHSASDSKES